MPVTLSIRNSPLNRCLQLCRTMHSWLGVIIMPWILIIGATGFFLNHERLVLETVGQMPLSSAQLAGLPQYSITEEMASNIATITWPEEPVGETGKTKYRGRITYVFKKNSGVVLVPAQQTSHYFVRSGLREQAYAMDGTLIHTHYNLKSLLKSLHERGWIGKTLGTWLADIVAGAMVFFSFTGIIMWSVPKLRRIRRRFAS